MHGFDDQGSQFDAKGNLRMWWTDEDRAKFTARTDQLAKQFDGFVAIDDLHVNGKLTLGENIAELGGLLVSYDAWRLATAKQKPEPIDGLSPEQRFFHGWAQGWRRLHTEQDQAASEHRRARPGQVPRARPLRQHRCLRHRIRLQGRRQDGRQARREGRHLVIIQAHSGSVTRESTLP
jgi:hypothetical protein